MGASEYFPFVTNTPLLYNFKSETEDWEKVVLATVNLNYCANSEKRQIAKI